MAADGSGGQGWSWLAAFLDPIVVVALAGLGAAWAALRWLIGLSQRVGELAKDQEAATAAMLATRVDVDRKHGENVRGRQEIMGILEQIRKETREDMTYLRNRIDDIAKSFGR